LTLKVLDRYLLLKPSVRALIEWPIFISIGVAGMFLSSPMLPFPTVNIIGAMVLIAGWLIHGWAHRIHKQAHETVEKIERVVVSGFYSKIRHPCYLGLILMNFGFAASWGVAWLLIPAVIFSALTVLTALREEKILLKKFGKRYEEYLRKVKWRFIPGIC
jgi:protein-S-isoprenylcysteine O-methyltransferase Ste14